MLYYGCTNFCCRCIMAQRWTIEEDYIVCKYCVENSFAFTSNVDIENIRLKLVKAGFPNRSNRAIKIRARDYDYLVGGYVDSPSMSDREREVVNLVYSGLQVSSWIDSYVEKLYRASEFVDAVNGYFDPNGNNVLQYLDIGEVTVQPSFYNILDELLEKYYVKH